MAARRPHLPTMQPSLFADDPLPLLPGARFVEDFLDRDAEADLLRTIGTLTLTEAAYKQYTARRRVAAFGGKFDYDTNELREAPPIPPELLPLRARVADIGTEIGQLAHAASDRVPLTALVHANRQQVRAHPHDLVEQLVERVGGT